MDELPADAAAVALAGAVASDAVTDAIELAEFFDVDVDEFAGAFSLLATHRRGRLQGSDPVQA